MSGDDTYTFKRAPMPHQRDAFERWKNAEYGALFWEQRCVDAETEYLSPEGWRRIENYTGGKIAQWNPDTRIAEYVEPKAYVKIPRGEMVRLKSVGVDQVLSLDHVVPVLKRTDYTPTKRLRASEIKELSARELYDLLKLKRGRALPGTFVGSGLGGNGLRLTEAQLRLQIAVMADASFTAAATGQCIFNLKKTRKKDRLLELADKAGVPVTVKPGYAEGFTRFTLYAPWRVKRYDSRFWQADYEQLVILADELPRWDGAIYADGRCAYNSVHKEDADFAQFCFSATGRISSIVAPLDSGGCWRVHVWKTVNHYLRHCHASILPPEPGWQYCFEVPSGFLLLRRNNYIFPTGNCRKTKPIFDIAGHKYLAGTIRGLAVVAWPSDVPSRWAEDAAKDVAVPHRIVVWKTGKMGSRDAKSKLDELLGFDGLSIVAVNCEAITTDACAAYLRKFYAKRRPVMLAADESEWLGSPGAARTKRMLAMGRASAARFILSGTPATESPFELFSQTNFLRHGLLGFNNYQTFKARYGAYRTDPETGARVKGFNRRTNTEYDILDGYRNLDELRSKLDEFSSRLLRADLAPTPDPVYQSRYFAMTKKQREVYDRLRDEHEAEIVAGDPTNVAHVLARLTLLQMVARNFFPPRVIGAICGACGGEALVDGTECLACGGLGYAVERTPMRRIDEERNPAAEALAAELSSTRDPFVVWCRFRQDVDECVAAARRAGRSVAPYSGDVVRDDRERAYDDFRYGRIDGIVATIGSGITRGHDLSRAELCAFYSNSYSLRNRLQAQDRLESLDRRSPPGVVDLIAEDTEDLSYIEAFREKRDVFSKVMGDRVKEWI